MENIVDLNHLTCRTCLTNAENSNSLFDCVEYETRIELKEILWRLSNVMVVANEDVQPTRICMSCTEKLLEAFDFLLRVEESEKRLNEYFESVKQLNADQQTNDYDETTDIKHEEEYIIEEISEAPIEEEYDFEDIGSLDLPASEILYQKDSEVVETESAILPNHEAIQTVGVETEYVLPQQLDAPVDNEMPDTLSVKSESQLLEPMEEEKLEDDFGAIIMEMDSQETTESRKVQNDTEESHFQCTTCDRVCANRDLLVRHQKSHRIIGNFQCNHCSRNFTRKDNLLRHMITHKETGEGPKKHKYKHGLCPHCGESFPQASLIIHIRRHTGEKPYKCDLCDKGYPRSQDLMIHKRSHTGEKPHLCLTCGKAFARPNKLARHIRVHTGERPYKCTQCSKAFAQSNDLNLHIRRHTGEKPYKCGVCEQGFINGTALNNHRKAAKHYSIEDQRPDRYEKIRVTNPHRPCWRTKIPYSTPEEVIAPSKENEESILS